ncbi:MAG: PQQ-binding-like beta-propeller repeat protein [Candidatus Bathyarchaeota archaeon]|nr:PQQ-binding-like beta-propeller repeat protein [Candidatus Bathyarchaeota archaeon]
MKTKLQPTIVVIMLLMTISNAPLLSTLGQNTQSQNNNHLLQYEWPQLQGDSSFARFSTGPAPDAPDIMWKTNITGIQSYLSAFNGKVYATTQTAVFAIDAKTGSILWKSNIHNPGPWPAVYKIDDTHMIVGNSCIDPENGRHIWSSNNFSATASPLFTNNVYSPQEKMFYIKAASYIQAWNFSNPDQPPTLIWETYVSGSGLVGSGIQYGDGKVFPGSFESHQIALDAKTGAVLWDTNTKGPMLFSGSYADGKFFRGGTHDNTLYAFDAATGEILWTFNPGSNGGYFCSGTAVAYGMVYALNKDGHLYAVDTQTGELVWAYKGPGTLMFPGCPTVADGKVYATTGQAASYGEEYGASEFACLDAYSGQVLWKLPIEAFAPRESVAIAYGNLYLIPANVTEAVDTISGAEYSTANQVWAIGTTAWPMWRHDPAHSATGQSGPTNLVLRWKFTTGGSVVSSPSIANGIAYFGSMDKYIYAVNAQHGNLIWKFQTQARIFSSPAVVDGKVYTGTDDGNIYCLNAYNGSLIWKTYAGGIVPANFAAAVILRSSPLVVNNQVYVGALDSNLYCFNGSTGDTVWKYQTKGPITSSPAVVDDAVYITSQEPTSGTLYKLNAQNGNLIWKKPLPYNIGFMGGTDLHSSPTIADGKVFVGTNAGTYYAIDTSTGNTLWTYNNAASEEFILCSPIYSNGNVFLVDKFSIVCVNATNGNPIWKAFLGDELYVSPSLAEDKLYVVTDQRHIFVLNATNGYKLSSFTTDSNSWSAPTIYQGRVYAGNNDWNVYCLADYAALSSNIILTLANSTVVSGEVARGSGKLTPAIANATITLTFIKPDGSASSTQVTTSTKGEFAFTLTPNEIGNWAIMAQWRSDKSYYASAASPALVLIVNPAPTPTLTASPSPTIPYATPTPFEEQHVAGIPMIYLYTILIAFLIVVIIVAAYTYRKRIHH